LPLPDKSRHSTAQVSDKWDQIKVLRNLDVDRLNASKDGKILTHRDWMVGALVALNQKEKNSKIVQ